VYSASAIKTALEALRDLVRGYAPEILTKRLFQFTCFAAKRAAASVLVGRVAFLRIQTEPL
jgi:hypothetical protein